MAISNFPPQAYTRDILASAYEWLRSQSPSIRELAQDSDSLVALYMQSRRRGLGAHVAASANHAAAHMSSANNTGLPVGASASPLSTGGSSAGASNTSGSYSGASTIESEMGVSSAQSFKQELKNLTEGLKQFDSPKAPASSLPTASAALPTASTATLPTPNANAATFASSPATPSQQQHVIAPYQNMATHPTAAAAQPHSQSHPQPQTYQQSPSQHHAQVQQHYQPPHHQPPPAAAVAPNVAVTSSSSSLDSRSLEMIHQVRVRLNLGSETEALRMIIAIGFDRIREILPKN